MDHGRFALGDGAGLVECEQVTLCHRLKVGCFFKEDSPFGSQGDTHQCRHRCRQTQCTGAGDHDHGDADNE